MRILVPSAGAASSVSVIKEARRRGHFVLATDLNQHAVGMHLADSCCLSGMCYEEPYINSIIGMCHKTDVGFVIPINDAELPVYNLNRKPLRDAGIIPLMNPKDCVTRGHDKEKSWAVCEHAKIRQPLRYFSGPSSHSHLWDDMASQMPPGSCFPLIAKPPMGVGGRGQYICGTPESVKRVLDSEDPGRLSQYLWQEYICGTEYSVDCWGDPATPYFVAVPRTRGKIINGQATGGMTCDDADVIDFARKICLAFGSKNVCCVQVMRRRSDGALYFIEFNPRYGTGVSLSFEAGIDFLQLQYLQATGQDIPESMLKYEVGVGMARYWEEKFYRGDMAFDNG